MARNGDLRRMTNDSAKSRTYHSVPTTRRHGKENSPSSPPLAWSPGQYEDSGQMLYEFQLRTAPSCTVHGFRIYNGHFGTL